MPPTQSPLRQIHLFHDLPAPVLDMLARAGRRYACPDGELLMLEGDPDDRIFFVLRGIIRAYRTNAEGREQNLKRLEAGDVFNLPTVFADGRITPATAVALGPAELWIMDGADFRRLASETPSLGLAVMRVLSNKLHHFTGLTHALSLQSVRSRLADFLLTHIAPDVSDDPDTPPIRWTHESIAAEIGTVREVVSRTLRAFAREGLIVVQRQHITITDPALLEQEITT